MVDEIETHLHPDLQTRLLRALRTALGENTMLLATTQSPTIIAEVPPSARYLMIHSSTRDRNGQLCDNQLLRVDSERSMAHTLYTMYGAASHAAATGLLEGLRNQAVSVSYAQECLLRSWPVGDARGADPQRTFIAGLIHGLNAKELRILDVGAGEGRLIKALEGDLRPGPPIALLVDVVEREGEARARLAALRESPTLTVKIGAIVEGVQDLPRGDDYDVIFLHNMLHECSFNELETLLSTTTKRLRIGGLVNVLEQARLPAGESNYFVFSAESCRDIFQALGFDVIVSERESYTGIPLYELSGKRTNAGGLGE
jgi:SAM-dependent methyltransferase